MASAYNLLLCYYSNFLKYVKITLDRGNTLTVTAPYSQDLILELGLIREYNNYEETSYSIIRELIIHSAVKSAALSINGSDKIARLEQFYQDVIARTDTFDTFYVFKSGSVRY